MFKLAWFDERSGHFAIDWGHDHPGRENGDCFVRAIADGEAELKDQGFTYTKPMSLDDAAQFIADTGVVGSCGRDIKKVLGLWVDGVLTPFGNAVVA